MKKIGLSLITASLLLVSLVIFQNCGNFEAVDGAISNQLNVSQSCTSGAMRACTVLNGTGSQICASNLWGACAAISCNTNFILSAGSCVPYSASLPCQGTFNATLLGQSTVLTMSETSAGAITIYMGTNPLATGTCSNGNINFTVNLTATSTAACSGTYTVASSKTSMTGNCSANGQTLPFNATQQ